MDYARLRAASDALWTSQLASLDAAMQQQAAQRQQMHHPFVRPFPLPGSTSVYILPRNGMPAAVVNVSLNVLSFIDL